jgi:phage tail-like protein
MSLYYPPVGFHFMVEFQFSHLSKKSSDILFQSVSGLNVTMQTETLKEGGENRFEHVIPVRSKYTELILKRGIFKPADSSITQWCTDAFLHFQFVPVEIIVNLLDEAHKPLIVWNVHHAWPKSWKLGDLNADKGEVLIETFEINYNYFTCAAG